MKINETTRRKVLNTSDSSPSIHHTYNFDISKKYIHGKVVLDIGCWTGVFCGLIKPFAKKVYGIDPGQQAIALAKKMHQDCVFDLGVADQLPYVANKFDVVTFLEVLEHLPQGTEVNAMFEIARVLKPGGILVLSTPNKHILSILGDPAFFLIGHRHYSMQYLTQLLTTNGFKVISKTKTGGIVRIVTVNLELIVKHVFKRGITWPNFVNRLVEGEYIKGGFFENHVIAQKLK